MAIADTNGDGSISWGEMKTMNLKGASVTSGGEQYRRPSMQNKLPIVRCYWHVNGPNVDRNSSDVLNVFDGGGQVERGHFMWQRDFGLFNK